MSERIMIAPSILSGDLGHIADSLDMIENADYVHIDVMDGHFVPNLTFGPEMVRVCKALTHLPLDVHLMVDNPDETAPWYIEAGADVVTVHLEATRHLNRLLATIKEAGAQAGVVLNPTTPVCLLENCIEDVDVVMLMSVNPGFSGQRFIEGTVPKLRSLKELCRAHRVHPLIEVDGGISLATIGKVVEAGANLLVAGSAVYGSDDPASMVDELRAAGVRALAARGARQI